MDSRTRVHQTFAQHIRSSVKRAAVVAMIACNLSGCAGRVDRFFNYPPELEFTI